MLGGPPQQGLGGLEVPSGSAIIAYDLLVGKFSGHLATACHGSLVLLTR